jgi:hypothetical protein
MGDLSPCLGGPAARLTHRVFISDETSLDAGFRAAQAGLAGLTGGGLLASASARAYGDGITGRARLAQVHFRELAACGDSARLALRWEAAGPDGGLFPVLDADLTLTPAGKHSATLTLTGAYRPPPGPAGAGLDRAIVRQVAMTTIRAFLRSITEAIGHPAGAETGAAGPAPAPRPPVPHTP